MYKMINDKITWVSTAATCLLRCRSKQDAAVEEEFESSTAASRQLRHSEVGADGRSLSPFICTRYVRGPIALIRAWINRRFI